ncbi:hypothetical protein BGZ83_003815 [Gryganskiella cystojenkinii]|nr:hypothetical protein BGZ83_003815 [Gryganskiella cystojenkinii]
MIATLSMFFLALSAVTTMTCSLLSQSGIQAAPIAVIPDQIGTVASLDNAAPLSVIERSANTVEDDDRVFHGDGAWSISDLVVEDKPKGSKVNQLDPPRPYIMKRGLVLPEIKKPASIPTKTKVQPKPTLEALPIPADDSEFEINGRWMSVM